MWVNKDSGQFTFPFFEALDAYWPGLLVSTYNNVFKLSLIQLLEYRWGIDTICRNSPEPLHDMAVTWRSS